MPKNDISYEVALQELQHIVDLLQEEALGIDELSVKVKRAADLIKICKEKLRKTEEQVQQVLTN